MMQPIFNVYKGKCPSCGINMISDLIIPLSNTYFNLATNNFTMLLNRREVARKLTLKLVKEMKKKNKCANSSQGKNKEDDISTWTCEYCKSFLKLHKASLQGNKKELIDRCVLLKFLIENNLEHMISLSKMELKSMSSALTLPFGEGITKDDMIRNVSDVLLGIFGDMSNGVLTLIEEEESELDLM